LGKFETEYEVPYTSVKNLLDISKLTRGSFINVNNGEVELHSQYVTTGLIPVYKETTYIFDNCQDWIRINLYDDDGHWLRGVEGNNSLEMFTSDSGQYIRLSYNIVSETNPQFKMGRK
jgi:hypothetical protein